MANHSVQQGIRVAHLSHQGDGLVVHLALMPGVAPIVEIVALREWLA